MDTLVWLPIEGEKETVPVDTTLAGQRSLSAFRITGEHPEHGIQAGAIGIVDTLAPLPDSKVLVERSGEVVCCCLGDDRARQGTLLGRRLLTVNNPVPPDDLPYVIPHLEGIPDFEHEAQEAEFWSTHGLARHTMSREHAHDIEHLLPPVRERARP